MRCNARDPGTLHSTGEPTHIVLVDLRQSQVVTILAWEYQIIAPLHFALSRQLLTQEPRNGTVRFL
ncbi:hypothetical protein J2Y68_003392 [Paenarthrobacter nitroguajacolicus]|nr:hypothetical protein [Paenarthrobacter nitroguajacolicus]